MLWDYKASSLYLKTINDSILIHLVVVKIFHPQCCAQPVAVNISSVQICLGSAFIFLQLSFSQQAITENHCKLILTKEVHSLTHNFPRVMLMTLVSGVNDDELPPIR